MRRLLSSVRSCVPHGGAARFARGGLSRGRTFPPQVVSDRALGEVEGGAGGEGGQGAETGQKGEIEAEGKSDRREKILN
jgi:hypothetical protein